MIQRVESIDDPRLALYRDVRDADLRGREGLFLVEGERIVCRFLKCTDSAGAATPTMPKHAIASALLSEECAANLSAALSRHPELPCFVGAESLLTSISGYRLHRGALALGIRGEEPSASHLLNFLGTHGIGPDALATDRGFDIVIATEGVTHVDNMGTLFRNAGSFGGVALLLDRNSTDPLLRKAIRISSGRVFTLPWARCGEIREAIPLFRRAGFRIVAAEETKQAIPLSQLDQWTSSAAAHLPSPRRTLVVFGNEDRGLSTDTVRDCDVTCVIPMRAPTTDRGPEDAPSLNVAVASAVFLHELRRCRS